MDFAENCTHLGRGGYGNKTCALWELFVKMYRIFKKLEKYDI